MRTDPILKADAKLKAIITEHMAAELKWIQEQLSGLESINGVIQPTAQNYALRAKLATALKQRMKRWVETTFASDEWLRKNVKGLPNTDIGAAIKWAEKYAAQAVNTGALVYDRMVTAVENITVINQQNFTDVREIIGKAIRTPGATYKTIIDSLNDTYKLAPGHAQTITRGVLMETFRLVNAEAVNEAPEEYGEDPEEVLYQLTGPEPMPMPDGHLFCVQHYGEVHTLKEWRILAAAVGGQGGCDPSMILEWCGGYNCRHGLRPVTRDNEKSAREDTLVYKNEQKRFEKELQNAA